MNVSSATEVDVSPDVEISRLLLRRIRSGLWLILTAALAFLLANLLFPAHRVGPVVFLLSVQLVVVVAAIVFLQQTVARDISVGVALAVVAVACATAAAAGVMTRNDAANPLLFILLTMGSATLLPWGAVPQLVTVFIASVSLLGNVLAVSGSLQAFGYPTAVAVAAAFSTSVYIAQVLESHRARIAAESAERRTAEDALRISQERYATAVRAGEVGVWDWDLQGNTFHIDPVLKMLLGYERHELSDAIGSWLQCGHPDDHPPLLEHMYAHRKDATPRFEFEHRLVRKDGSTRWFLSRGRVLRNDSGDAVRLLGAETDITALKDAQRAQQEEAEVSAALAHVAQAMIAVLDTPVLLERVCRVVSEVLHSERSHTWMLEGGLDVYVPVAQHGCSPAQWEFLRALRIPADLFGRLTERLGNDDVVIVSDAERAALLPPSLADQLGLRQAIFMALRHGDRIVGMQSAEYAQVDGPFRPAAIRIAHGIAQLASLMWHHARLREDLERANRLKSDFVATMSHELRTPLHAIMGYNDLVLDGDFGPLTADQEDALDHVRKSARHLREVIDGILDLSRLERGQLPLNVATVSIPHLMQRVTEEMAGSIDKPSVVFSWELEPALPVVRTDPDKLMVVLKNVIANAIKFTAEGHVTVTIGADAEALECAVADTGVGISPETLQIIFEPFRQAERYLTRRFDGLGLGLYVVRRLVDVLGGTIDVESELGRGSCFRIRIPLSPPGSAVV